MFCNKLWITELVMGLGVQLLYKMNKWNLSEYGYGKQQKMPEVVIKLDKWLNTDFQRSTVDPYLGSELIHIHKCGPHEAAVSLLFGVWFSKSNQFIRTSQWTSVQCLKKNTQSVLEISTYIRAQGLPKNILPLTLAVAKTKTAFKTPLVTSSVGGGSWSGPGLVLVGLKAWSHIKHSVFKSGVGQSHQQMKMISPVGRMKLG